MAQSRYMMISTVSCAAEYHAEASEHLTSVMDELKAALPTVSAYFGAFQAGRHAGSLGLVHVYQDLVDVDPAFDVYGASPNFATAAGSGKIALRERNLVRLMETEQRGSDDIPTIQVVLRFNPPGLSEETRSVAAGAAMDAGATQVRLGTIWTGTIAGSQILSLGCPTIEVAKSVEGICREALPGALPEKDVLRILG